MGSLPRSGLLLWTAVMTPFLVSPFSPRATEALGGSQRTVQFLPPLGARRDFGPLKLQADEYFMLGDNRDNSEDSRFIGPVQRKLLIGRAHHIVVSADILGWWKPRFERTAAPIR